MARLARPARPYVVLVTALLAIRSIPPLDARLTQIGAFAPYPDHPAFAPLHHASVWLLAAALLEAMIALPRSRLGPVLRRATGTAIEPVGVTLLFMVLAEYVAASGIATHLAQAGTRAFGTAAALLGPAFAAAAGLIGSSNTASNGLAMPIQIALAREAGIDHVGVAAVQNTVGSRFCLLAPVRISVGCALAGVVGMERRVYRLVMPLGAIALAVGFGAAAVLLASR